MALRPPTKEELERAAALNEQPQEDSFLQKLLRYTAYASGPAGAYTAEALLPGNSAIKALGQGALSGASLGYAGEEGYKPETTTQTVANVAGHIAGGSLPFLGLEALTAGAATPALATRAAEMVGGTASKLKIPTEILGKGFAEAPWYVREPAIAGTQEFLSKQEEEGSRIKNALESAALVGAGGTALRGAGQLLKGRDLGSIFKNTEKEVANVTKRQSELLQASVSDDLQSVDPYIQDAVLRAIERRGSSLRGITENELNSGKTSEAIDLIKKIMSPEAEKQAQQAEKDMGVFRELWADNELKAGTEADSVRNLADYKEGTLDTIMNRVFLSAGSVLKKFGQPGEELLNKFDTIRRYGKQYVGSYNSPFLKELKKTNPTAEEFDLISKAVDSEIPEVTIEQLPENLRPLAGIIKQQGDILGAHGQDVKLVGWKRNEAGELVRNDTVGRVEGYWPGQYSKAQQEVIASEKGQKVLDQALRESGKFPTEEALLAYKRRWLQDKTSRKVGEQIERIPGLRNKLRTELGIDVSRTPMDWLEHVDRYGQRIVQAQLLGPGDEIGKALLDQIKEKADANTISTVDTIYNRLRGSDTYDAALSSALRDVRNLMTITKLSPRTTVLNYMQRFNLLPFTGVKGFVEVNRQAKVAENIDFAHRALGIVPPNVGERAGLTEALANQTGIDNSTSIGRFAEKYLKFIKFTETEYQNKVRGALAGRYTADTMFDKLAQNPQDQIARRTLTQLKIDPDQALKVGRLTEQDHIAAAQEMDRLVNFWYDNMDLPVGWTSPTGKTITQFKAAAYYQFKLYKDVFLKEAAKGNVLPLISALATAGISGEIISDVRKVLLAQDPTKRPMDKTRFLENLSYGSGMGLASDAVNLMLNGAPQWIPGYIGGPAFGEATSTIQNIQPLLTKGNARPLLKQTVGNVSRPLQSILFPPKD